MTTLHYNQMPVRQLGPKVERRLGHTDNLMIVVIDFYDGPTSEPDPPHAHSHEQVTYVAEGELLFIIDGEESRLGPGDVALVPSGVSHTIQRLSEHIRLVDSFTPLRQDFLTT